MSKVRLGVNVDHVATLRQARRTSYPDPVTAAALAELAGADQITVHLREDRRHIQDRDLKILRETVRTALNLEMAATQEMVKVAYATKPDLVTLVPERREELTTEGGLDLASTRENIEKIVANLKDADIQVALFIDPELEHVKIAHRLGVQRVELHTGRYCSAKTETALELSRLRDAAKLASKLGIGCAAGHGLDYVNVAPVVGIGEIDELNIGHSIVSRALMVGFDRAIRDMVALLRRS